MAALGFGTAAAAAAAPLERWLSTCCKRGAVAAAAAVCGPLAVSSIAGEEVLGDTCGEKKRAALGRLSAWQLCVCVWML